MVRWSPFFSAEKNFFFPFSFTFSSRRASVRCCAQRVQLSRSPRNHCINNINTNRQRRGPHRRCRYLRNFHDFLCSPTNVRVPSTFARTHAAVDVSPSYHSEYAIFVRAAVVTVVVVVVVVVVCCCWHRVRRHMCVRVSGHRCHRTLCSRRSTTAPTSLYSGDYPQR